MATNPFLFSHSFLPTNYVFGMAENNSHGDSSYVYFGFSKGFAG